MIDLCETCRYWVVHHPAKTAVALTLLLFVLATITQDDRGTTPYSTTDADADANAIDVIVTGTTAIAAGDVIFKGMTVEFVAWPTVAGLR